MKKILLGLIATVMFSVMSFAQQTAKPKPKGFSLASLIGLEVNVEIVNGQNQVINGVRYSCIGGGICYFKYHVSFNKNANTYLATDKEDGSLYIITDTPSETFVKDTVMNTDTTIDEETLVAINKAIKEKNPKAKEFLGIPKGTVLSPFQDNKTYVLKIN